MKPPLIAKGDADINKLSDELIFRIGGFKKNIMLPTQPGYYKPAKAKLEGEHLLIIIKGEDHGQEK
jgi:hypothetical protein